MRQAKPPKTDAELVAAARAGSAEAFRALVERFQRPVLSVISRMVGDLSLAEDLAQEVFVKAYRKLGTFDPRRRLSSWLFKIAHNTTLDHLRRTRLATVPLEAAGADGEEAWEIPLASGDPDPERRVEQRQLVAGLEAALGRLAPSAREILLLRFQQGLTYHEIAEVTGVAIGTVKVRLHRARKRLAAEMAAAGFEPPARWRRKTRRRA